LTVRAAGVKAKLTMPTFVVVAGSGAAPVGTLGPDDVGELGATAAGALGLAVVGAEVELGPVALAPHAASAKLVAAPRAAIRHRVGLAFGVGSRLVGAGCTVSSLSRSLGSLSKANRRQGYAAVFSAAERSVPER